MPPPPGGSDSTVSGATGATASGTDSLDMDAMMANLAGVSSSSTRDSGLESGTFASYLLRQRASSAYMNMDNLIAGLFDSGATSQSVSMSA
jgi:hypothetical protein